MAITLKQKQSFTLLEVLIAMLLLSFILVISVKAYSYISTNSRLNEIRYYALNKIDSEMNRLVFGYEKFDEGDFANNEGNTSGDWNGYFKVPKDTENVDTVRIYKKEKSPVKEKYGLNVDGNWAKQNIVEILDTQGDPNVISTGDIVGLLAWRVEHNSTTSSVHLSLSITYPYKAKIKSDMFGTETQVKEMPLFELETINLKTSTKE